MEENSKSLWVARDEDGSLYLYWRKPERDKPEDEYGTFYIDPKYRSDIMFLDYRLFPEVTWENSPQPLITPITKQDE